MKTKNIIIGLIVLVLVGVGVVYFLTKEAVMTKIRVGTMPITDNLAFFVAQEKGYFQKEGLEIEEVPKVGGAAVQPALEAGELNIGWSNVVSVIIAHEKGFDYKFLTPGAFKDLLSADLLQLHVRADSPIMEPKDIEGKTVAVNTFKNILGLALMAWADKYDVDYDTLKVVEVPFPQMQSALEAGEIDVAFYLEPQVTMAITSGVARVLDARPFDALAERLMIASWIAKQSWMDKNPKTAKAFINAINKANKYIVEHPAEMRDIVAKYTGLPKEVAYLITLSTFFEDLNRQDLQVTIDAAYKYGYIKEKFAPEELVIEGLELK